MSQQVDPWAGFALGEDREVHDPAKARHAAWRGRFWVQIRIGTWWVVAIQTSGLVLFLVSLVGRWEPAILTLVWFLVVVVVTLVADQLTTGWTEDHNARVRRALELERTLADRPTD